METIFSIIGKLFDRTNLMKNKIVIKLYFAKKILLSLSMFKIRITVGIFLYKLENL